MSYLTRDEIENFGFNKIGRNVLISDKTSIYNPQKISIGDNVRIDDFCILSAGDGGIEIGNYVHIASYSSLIGKEKIKLGDYSGLSSRVSIYSSSDDYSGLWMTNPTVPSTFTNVVSKPVILEKHVIVGCGAVILPGVLIQEGTAIAALSLVKKSCEPFYIYHGNPAKKIFARKKVIKNLERNLEEFDNLKCQK